MRALRKLDANASCTTRTAAWVDRSVHDRRAAARPSRLSTDRERAQQLGWLGLGTVREQTRRALAVAAVLGHDVAYPGARTHGHDGVGNSAQVPAGLLRIPAEGGVTAAAHLVETTDLAERIDANREVGRGQIRTLVVREVVLEGIGIEGSRHPMAEVGSLLDHRLSTDQAGGLVVESGEQLSEPARSGSTTHIGEDDDPIRGVSPAQVASDVRTARGANEDPGPEGFGSECCVVGGPVVDHDHLAAGGGGLLDQRWQRPLEHRRAVSHGHHDAHGRAHPPLHARAGRTRGQTRPTPAVAGVGSVGRRRLMSRRRSDRKAAARHQTSMKMHSPGHSSADSMVASSWPAGTGATASAPPGSLRILSPSLT